MHALKDCTQQSRLSLAEAREHLEQAQRQMAQVCTEVQILTQQVREQMPTLQRHLETIQEELDKSFRLAGQHQEIVRQDILAVKRLTRTVLVLSLLAFGAAFLAVLFLLRSG